MVETTILATVLVGRELVLIHRGRVEGDSQLI